LKPTRLTAPSLEKGGLKDKIYLFKPPFFQPEADQPVAETRRGKYYKVPLVKEGFREIELIKIYRSAVI
jgi:hypothetical protein